MRAGSKWSCTNPVNDNWIEGDLYNSLSMTAALVHTTLYTRLCTHGLVHTTCTRGLSTHGDLGHVACTLRSVHHGHPRQYTGLYTTVCNHDLYTMACTHGLYTWLAHTTLHTRHGLPRPCKQHLNAFAITTRSFECFGLGQRPRHITGLLNGAFGQHCALSGQLRQSRLLAR